jgi:FixJ family two-component response regulator
MVKNARISIVDDDESVRSSIRNYFLAAGLEVETFSSAENFLASSSRASTDCLVTDLHMPGIDGLELQRELRAEGQSYPIIMMTGYPSEQARATARELGAAAFMEKPIDPDDLLEQIESVLA